MIEIFKHLLLLFCFEFDDECPVIPLTEREREREIIIINLDTPTGYTFIYIYIYKRKQNGLFIYMCQLAGVTITQDWG